MAEHTASLHVARPGDVALRCRACTYSGQDMTQWQEHMNTCSYVRGKTVKTTPQLCPFCAARPSCGLQQHWVSAHLELCFSCSLCPMVFARLQEGEAHLRQEHGKGGRVVDLLLLPGSRAVEKGGEVLWGAWAAVRCKECDYTGVGLQVRAGGLAGEHLP